MPDVGRYALQYQYAIFPHSKPVTAYYGSHSARNAAAVGYLMTGATVVYDNNLATSATYINDSVRRQEGHND